MGTTGGSKNEAQRKKGESDKSVHVKEEAQTKQSASLLFLIKSLSFR